MLFPACLISLYLQAHLKSRSVNDSDCLADGFFFGFSFLFGLAGTGFICSLVVMALTAYVFSLCQSSF
jgi:hypothetical protein